MDLICNELSYFPVANNDNEAEKRFIQLIKTFKVVNEKLGFNTIRFHTDYGSELITADQNFLQWISSLKNSTLKNLVLSFFKKPFADDLQEEELDKFLSSEYELIGENKPTDNKPYGLPIAHIKSRPSISFNSHEFWRQRKFLLNKISENREEVQEMITFNICLETDIRTSEFTEWCENFMSRSISDKNFLQKFFFSSKYDVIFSEEFLNSLFEWKESNFETFKYILILMKDVHIHPFMGGMGHTENLKGRGKEGSKRINQKDRLSYTVEKDVVNYISCKGHYDFH